MRMERPRRIRSPEWISDDGAIVRAREADHCSATATQSAINGIHNTSPATPSSSSGGLNFIEHRVSKMDTLAGVAIKYGVEIADIKRMNGLVTDLQMFAHKSLQIPLPGRHPPSPVLSNGSAGNGSTLIKERSPWTKESRDLFTRYQKRIKEG
ncbi:F-box protein [Acorus calamus]|uniref:F-box protein n=1 Tax=Acorus calamus TaxID=4465 RepID=A0AAV9F9S6_ACOCL|nr:F-box protein [Acorus calamus]